MKILVTESQLNRCIIEEEKSCDVFNNTTTERDYDDALLNKESKRIKAMVGEMVQMTPNEYLDRCAQLEGTTLKYQYSLIDQEKVRAYSEKMSMGVKYHLPYIDYFGKQQEGRHRVLAAKMMGCEVVKIGVFNEEGQNDPYNKEIDEDKVHTLEELKGRLNDVQIDHDDVFVQYKHDWKHERDVQLFLGLYPKFSEKIQLFYACMDKLRMRKDGGSSDVFKVDPSNFVVDEDPKELTNYIWEEIVKRTNEQILYNMGYREQELSFPEVCEWLYNVNNDLDILTDLNKLVGRMLHSVSEYSFYENNRDYFSQVESEYRVEIGSGEMRVYSTDLYSWDKNIESGRELLRENRVMLSYDDPEYPEKDGQGKRIISLKNIEIYLKEFPIR